MFEQAFKNIDDILWKDDGVDNELDYTEQTVSRQKIWHRSHKKLRETLVYYSPVSLIHTVA